MQGGCGGGTDAAHFKPIRGGRFDVTAASVALYSPKSRLPGLKGMENKTGKNNYFKAQYVIQNSRISTMRFLAAFVICLVLVTAFFSNRAVAQVPPHVPGDICLIPGAWCWADAAGNPGEPCFCGSVGGIYG